MGVWVWICRILHELAAKGKIKNKLVMVPELDALCAKARGCIGATFAITDTQLPFQYIHLLMYVTIVSNMLVAVKCGVMIGFMLTVDDSDSENKTDVAVIIGVYAFELLFVPFMYHAFLRLCAQVENPLGDD